MANLVSPMAHLHNPHAFSPPPPPPPPTTSSLSLPKTLTPRAQRSKSNHPPPQPNFSIPSKDQWNLQKRVKEAIEVLDMMHAQGLPPDRTLFCILLKMCSENLDFSSGLLIHDKIRVLDLETDIMVANKLMDFYAKCGRLLLARRLFNKMREKNTVSWTTLISAYYQSGQPHRALKLFDEMKRVKALPNVFTYTVAFNACSKVGDLERGRKLHRELIEQELESDEFIGSALIDMYGKCRSIDDALKVFDEMKEPSLVACTAMIDSYNLNGKGKEAMALIRRILSSGLSLEAIKELGFSCMIRACSHEMALKQGQEIHAQLIKTGFDSDVRVLDSLIDMYRNCGKMDIALYIFDGLLVRNVNLWCRVIMGCVDSGWREKALRLFADMISDGLEPNPSLIISVMRACDCVEEGKGIHGQSIKLGLLRSMEVNLNPEFADMYRRFSASGEAQKLDESH
ncbi:hypothetical protein AMTR_s00057p00172690 [Amborella trichopoda]|uniref:Pentacotripeptide-repeat region of PRORP domain-containing protein n=2 Tax=Amborella trichopoda TaxID=13333 RepID=U5D3U3_AMBTC|nr:hypothetical protein AMTR_s00057p00172690 [Amborella trichopoda]